MAQRRGFPSQQSSYTRAFLRIPQVCRAGADLQTVMLLRSVLVAGNQLRSSGQIKPKAPKHFKARPANAGVRCD
jgi:hypothetical protein